MGQVFHQTATGKRKWKIHHLLVVKSRPGLRVVRLNPRHIGRDLNGFGGRTNLENKIDSKDLGSLENNSRSFQTLEARLLRRDDVRSHWQVRARILAPVI